MPVAEFGRYRTRQPVVVEVQGIECRKVAEFRRNYVVICNMLYINMLHHILLAMYHLQYAEMNGIAFDGIGSQRT